MLQTLAKAIVQSSVRQHRVQGNGASNSGNAQWGTTGRAMSLINSLPAPKHALPPPPTAPSPVSFSPAAAKEPPRYLRRQGFVPRKQEDFGDGGAFPEVHVAQYPLDMGKAPAGGKGGGVSNSVQTLAVTVGAEGDINFDAVVNQGKNSDKIVYSRHEDLMPKVEELDKEVRCDMRDGPCPGTGTGMCLQDGLPRTCGHMLA